MTNKTINGVSRALLQSLYTDTVMQWGVGGNAAGQLRALLAAPDPIVCEVCRGSGKILISTVCGHVHKTCACQAPDPIFEADGIGEPVAWYVRIPDEPGDPEESPAEYFWANSIAELTGLLKSPGASVERRLYSADQLAALQSTIAQLKAENERLRSGIAYLVGIAEDFLKLADAPSDIPLGFGSELLSRIRTCLDEVRRMNP